MNRKNILLLGFCDINPQIDFWERYLDQSKYKLYCCGTSGTSLELQLFNIDYSIHYDIIIVSQLCNLNEVCLSKLLKLNQDSKKLCYSWETTDSFWSDKCDMTITTRIISQLLNSFDICERLKFDYLNFEDFKDELKYEGSGTGVHFKHIVYENLVKLLITYIDNTIDKNRLNRFNLHSISDKIENKNIIKSKHNDQTYLNCKFSNAIKDSNIKIKSGFKFTQICDFEDEYKPLTGVSGNIIDNKHGFFAMPNQINELKLTLPTSIDKFFILRRKTDSFSKDIIQIYINDMLIDYDDFKVNEQFVQQNPTVKYQVKLSKPIILPKNNSGVDYKCRILVNNIKNPLMLLNIVY